jgi:hypothetical protein
MADDPSSNALAGPAVASVVLGPGEGRDIPLGDGGVDTVKAERRHSGGAMTAYEFVVPPRTAGPPLHSTGAGTRPSPSSRGRSRS